MKCSLTVVLLLALLLPAKGDNNGEDSRYEHGNENQIMDAQTENPQNYESYNNQRQGQPSRNNFQQHYNMQQHYHELPKYNMPPQAIQQNNVQEPRPPLLRLTKKFEEPINIPIKQKEPDYAPEEERDDQDVDQKVKQISPNPAQLMQQQRPPIMGPPSSQLQNYQRAKADQQMMFQKHYQMHVQQQMQMQQQQMQQQQMQQQQMQQQQMQQRMMAQQPQPYIQPAQSYILQSPQQQPVINPGNQQYMSQPHQPSAFVGQPLPNQQTPQMGSQAGNSGMSPPPPARPPARPPAPPQAAQPQYEQPQRFASQSWQQQRNYEGYGEQKA